MKGQGLPISTIIIAALGILVLVVLGAIFSAQTGKFTRAANECPGKCYKAGTWPAGASEMQFSTEGCNEFETRLSGTFTPKNMPSRANPTEWRCDECCIVT